jgi:hypothetical protein
MLHDPRKAKQLAPSIRGCQAVRSPTFLRLALGAVYLHFGVLKFYPDLSPAELIASQTLMHASQQWLDARSALMVLAVVETAIGLGFLFNVCLRMVFMLFMIHMAGTFLPLLVFPEFTFKFVPFAPTLEGQYIFKNLIFVAAGWTVLRPHLRSLRVGSVDGAVRERPGHAAGADEIS